MTSMNVETAAHLSRRVSPKQRLKMIHERNETVMYLNVMAKERVGLDELIQSRLSNSVVKGIKFFLCYTEPGH
jgi:hypothetical protein